MEEKKNAKPVVSVVMPMHNSAKYLREAIESVRAQTYRRWELLIIDDASTDGSADIAREYAEKDDRIHVLKNENPIGMPSAPRNIGIQEARGRFIAFLDSDDMWYAHKLEQQLPLFRDPFVAIAYSNYEKTDENSKRRDRIVSAPRQADYKTLLRGNVIGNLTGIYDTRKTGKVIIKDTHHEDYAMWLQILHMGFIARNTGTIAAAYRITNGSVSASKLRTMQWQWNIYRNIEHIPPMKSAWYFLHYAYKAFFKSLI